MNFARNALLVAAASAGRYQSATAFAPQPLASSPVRVSTELEMAHGAKRAAARRVLKQVGKVAGAAASVTLATAVVPSSAVAWRQVSKAAEAVETVDNSKKIVGAGIAAGIAAGNIAAKAFGPRGIAAGNIAAKAFRTFGSSATTSTAGPDITKDEVRALFSLWNNALATGDSRIVAKRYAKNPVLLPTVSDTPRTDYNTIKDYFDGFLLKQPQGTILDGNILIGDGWAQDMGIYEVRIPPYADES